MQNRASIVLSIAVLVGGLAVVSAPALAQGRGGGGTRRRRAQGGAGPSAGRADPAHCRTANPTSKASSAAWARA